MKKSTDRSSVILISALRKIGIGQNPGGVLVLTSLLKKEVSKYYKLWPIDSAGVFPVERASIRARKAFGRFYKFAYFCKLKCSRVALIFCSRGFSFLEKIFLCAVGKIFKVKSILYICSELSINITPIFFRAIYRMTINTPDIIIVQGNTLAKAIIALGADEKKIRIIENCIETKLFSVENRKIYDKKDPIFLFVGALIKRKGVYDLIYSFRDFLKDMPAARLIITGGGDEAYVLQKFIENNKLEQNIRLMGWVDQETMVKCYADADIFVLPSYTESFPGSVLEAMCAGLPIITTPVGSIPDILTEGVNCLFTPPGNRAHLLSAIKILSENSILRKKMSFTNAQQAKQYDFRSVSKKLIAVIRELEISG